MPPKFIDRFRRGHESTPVSPTAEQAEVNADPHAFIERFGGELDKSRQIWKDIAGSVSELRESAYCDSIQDGIVELWEQSGDLNTFDSPEAAQDEASKSATRFTEELSVYSLITARYFALTIPQSKLSDGVKLGKEIRDHYTNIDDPYVNYLLWRKAFPSRRFLGRQGMLMKDMVRADIEAEKVLKGLADTYATQPEKLTELADLFAGGAADADPRFRELKQMITSDWQQPDPQKSILRQFCKQLRQEPSRYVAAFSKLAASPETKNANYTALQEMAKMAIVATGKSVDQGVIEETLMATADRWDEIKGVSSLFRAFTNERVKEVETTLGAIAGPRNTKNIRVCPPHSAITQIKDTFAISRSQTGHTREQRRANKRQRIKETGSDALPSLADIEAAATPEVEQKMLSLQIGVRGPSGHLDKFSPATIEDIRKKFKLDKSPELARDITAMIQHLQVTPMGPGSAPATSANASTRRSKHGANWYFAPNRCPGLRISGDNRYYRIVYVLLKNEGAKSLGIVDVLDHGTFDQKYAG